MENIDSQILCKYQIIKYILDSNKNSNYHFIYEDKKQLIPWIFNLKKDNFFKALVLFNFNSYIGYFSLIEREHINDCLLEDNEKNFNKLIIEYDKPYLEKEMLALNLWLARMIISNEECKYKYYRQAQREIISSEKINNFKNQIKVGNNTYDLCFFLKSLIKNKIKLAKDQEDWIYKHYEKEINIVKNFIDYELTSEITNK